MNLLNLTDSDYAAAAADLAANAGVIIPRIKNVLSNYVDLATGKKISDYPGATIGDQAAIADAVAKAASSFFDGYTTAETRNVLNSLAISADLGTVDQRIAYPRRWEIQQEQAQATSHSTSTGGPADTSISKSINDAFSGLFSTVGNSFSALANSLGISPAVLIIGIVLLLALPLIRSFSAA